MSTQYRTETSHWTPSPSAPVPSAPQPLPPSWDQGWAQRSTDPYASDESRFDSPREPAKSRFVTGLVIGLIVALLTGVGAYFLGTATKGTPVAGPSATPSPSLDLFAANLKAVNEPKFTGDLVPLAQRWLPYAGSCLTDKDRGGPKLYPDETKHVYCLYGGVQVHFAQYKSEAEMNSERVLREQLNQTTTSLLPGQQAPSLKTGGGSHVQGEYVEYALKDAAGRPLCGIWWNLEHSSGAVYLLALCHEVLNDQWVPLRDLWRRFS